ncbi:MAG TPA: MFS transporter, partial [Candidatus Limnocylindrales bacterium]|nr:MFS transporter [Candidatus Limnocylindrales bacterium]
MLLAGIVLGLIAGLAAGGRIDNLLAIRLRWTLLIFAAVLLRLATEAALQRQVAAADQLRVPLLASAYFVLALALWGNRSRPGIGLALVGTALNATAILVNGGFMPVWAPSLEAAGLAPADVLSPIHFLLPNTVDLEFLLHAGPLGDLIPVPIPFARNVLSIGDALLAAGLAFFAFAGVLREPRPEDRPGEAGGAGAAPLGGIGADGIADGGVAVATGLGAGHRVRPATGLAPAMSPAMALERPLMLGGSGAGVSAPAPTAVPRAPGGVVTGRGYLARALGHPYVRLAQNGSFGALWVGQLVSLFGDRVHQIALAFLVLGTTNSAIAVALTFVAATLPNLVFGPLAGVLVDRWDQKRVMVASDLLRAVLVLLLPVAAEWNVVAVYPLVFAVTTISIFFRPARTAVIPRIVRDDELVAANSSIWLGETIADVIGYPLATLFVSFLGGSFVLAFWLDAASYAASALLIITMSIPAALRTVAAALPGLRGLRDDLVGGWRFLHDDAVLRANTIQAVVGQFAIGVTIALMAVYARDALVSGAFDEKARYGFIEAAIGFGNLLGGFVIGLVGARIARGPMVIVGYVGYGACVAGLALTGNLQVAVALALGMGVANM